MLAGGLTPDSVALAVRSTNARQVDAIDPKPETGDRIVGVLPFFHVFAII